MPVRAARPKRAVSWPTGKVEITTGLTGPIKDRPGNDFGRVAIELRGGREPFFRDLSLEFEPNGHPIRAIVAYDGWGRVKWEVPLAQKDDQRQGISVNYNSPVLSGRADGHLLLVSLGSKIVALDTLGSGSAGVPRMLWMQDLTSTETDFTLIRIGGMQLMGLPPQVRQQFLGQSGRSQFAPCTLAAMGSHYACFQRTRNLVAVDPQSGETLWARQDLPPGCDLFGDDQYVFALPPDGEEATVLRALDGEVLGTRKVPRLLHQLKLGVGLNAGKDITVPGRFAETCLTTLGRKLLLWWPEGNQRVLTLVDPWEGRDVWPGRKFSAGACACVVADEAVGVMEPSGRFVLMSLPDGRTIADVKLEAEPSLGRIILFESGGQYFLVASAGQADVSSMIRFLPGGGSSKQINHGRLYAFDRQGKLGWAAPVEIREPRHACQAAVASSRVDLRLPSLPSGKAR